LSRRDSEKRVAEQRLASLSARLQAETLMKQQSAAILAGIGELVQERSYDAALERLESLEGDPVVEIYLVDLLTQLVRSAQAQGGAAVEAAAVEAVEERLAVKNEKIAELEEQVRAALTGRDTLVVERLQGRVDSLEAELRSLQTERDGLSSSLQRAQGARTESFEQGRDEALRDVITYLMFLSGGGEADRETERRLLALAGRDPLFRAATREIQILIAGGSSAGELASPFLFLGIVSSVASGRAVIEAMVDLDVSAGSVIQIRRIADAEREIIVAEGTVQQVRGSKITASYKTVASAEVGPEVRDPVYLVREGN
jgi:hypothetical protein